MTKVLHSMTGAVLCPSVAGSLGSAVEEAVRSRADLRGADLDGADLHGADLHGADLRGASLPGAYLSGAHLRGADLRGADLRGASLRGADLRGADLHGADLHGADLRGAYLRGVKGLLPRGITPLQIGGTRDWVIVRQAGYVTIGCEHHAIAWWREHGRKLAGPWGYTEEEIAEYSAHIDYCERWMKARGLDQPEAEAHG